MRIARTGRFAGLLLLDANPLSDIANSQRIHAVVMNCRVFDRPALDSMLATVLQSAAGQP